MAIIGLLIGHQVDRGFAARFIKFRPELSAEQLAQLPESFTRDLFLTMGHLAKADGRVTENEIRAARALMHRLGLGPAQIHKAMASFERGKDPAFPLVATIRKVRTESARRAEMRGLFVRLLMEVALSKPTLHQHERRVLWQICTELEIGRVEFAQLEAMLRAQKGFRQSTAGRDDTRRVNDAYEALGVDETSTNADIKRAYRRLMNKNHPDKLISENPDDARIAEAQRKTHEVRNAYEMLKVRRSIR
jgi:DnaJ like chaperone protein